MKKPRSKGDEWTSSPSRAAIENPIEDRSAMEKPVEDRARANAAVQERRGRAALQGRVPDPPELGFQPRMTQSARCPLARQQNPLP